MPNAQRPPLRLVEDDTAAIRVHGEGRGEGGLIPLKTAKNLGGIAISFNYAE